MVLWLTLRMTSHTYDGTLLNRGLGQGLQACSAIRPLRCGEDATLPWTFASEPSLSAVSPSRGTGCSVQGIGMHATHVLMTLGDF